MNAAERAAAAAAPIRDTELSEALHAVDRSTQLCAGPSHGLWDLLYLSKFEDPAVAAF